MFSPAPQRWVNRWLDTSTVSISASYSVTTFFCVMLANLCLIHKAVTNPLFPETLCTILYIKCNLKCPPLTSSLGRKQTYKYASLNKLQIVTEVTYRAFPKQHILRQMARHDLNLIFYAGHKLNYASSSSHSAEPLHVKWWSLNYELSPQGNWKYLGSHQSVKQITDQRKIIII